MSRSRTHGGSSLSRGCRPMPRRKKPPNPHRILRDNARPYYDAMLASQGGVCAICKRPPAPGARRFNIDHDHRAMYIRGILCTRCNKWLWAFVTIEILRATIEYLLRGPEWFD